MRRNIRKTNNSIMFGIMAMAILVLLVVAMFWVLGMPQDQSILPEMSE